MRGAGFGMKKTRLMPPDNIQIGSQNREEGDSVKN
jgi:hypothetical protein